MARKIQLTQGKSALVDDKDYEWLMQWKWCVSTGYAYRGFGTRKNSKGILMHREILKPKPHRFVDHINGNGFDNRRNNLRVCSRKQNNRHRIGARRTTSSRFKGVTKNRNTIRFWQAQITANYKHYCLGSFASEIEAARAYNKAAKRLHGKFALLNDV